MSRTVLLWVMLVGAVLIAALGSAIVQTPYRTVTEAINRRDGTLIKREVTFLILEKVEIEEASELDRFGALPGNDFWIPMRRTLQRHPWSDAEIDREYYGRAGDDPLCLQVLPPCSLP
jgi:hypothetical protein